MRIVLALLLTGCAIQAPAELVQVNRLVHAQNTYEDKPKGHVPQVMKPGEAGNCADYAVTKCAMLREGGYSPERLSLVKFIRWDGMHHAVCVVDGKWALDWKDYPLPATRNGLRSVTDLFPYTPAVAWK